MPEASASGGDEADETDKDLENSQDQEVWLVLWGDAQTSVLGKIRREKSFHLLTPSVVRVNDYCKNAGPPGQMGNARVQKSRKDGGLE